jgi:hypothetical protein
MARFSTQISKIAAMTSQCCVGIVVVLAIAPAPGMPDSARAASASGTGDVDRLISATFFSDACRQRAASLGILSTTDAQFLIEAFAQSIDADPPDVRAEKRAGSARALIEDADCDVPAVALINLLRLNSVAAEPVLLPIRPTGPSDPARFDKFSSLAVYVQSLGRYVDPAARDGRSGAAFDRAVRARAERVHLIGPAPYGNPATDRCGSICMDVRGRIDVFNPFLTDAIRVKTETIHAP